MLSTN